MVRKCAGRIVCSRTGLAIQATTVLHGYRRPYPRIAIRGEKPAAHQPIHVLNFLPKQRGHLRVFDASGQEAFSELLPENGLFEVGFGADENAVWCWPASWFSRGMGGEAWLPVDSAANTIYRIEPSTGA